MEWIFEKVEIGCTTLKVKADCLWLTSKVRSEIQLISNLTEFAWMVSPTSLMNEWSPASPKTKVNKFEHPVCSDKLCWFEMFKFFSPLLLSVIQALPSSSLKQYNYKCQKGILVWNFCICYKIWKHPPSRIQRNYLNSY